MPATNFTCHLICDVFKIEDRETLRKYGIIHSLLHTIVVHIANVNRDFYPYAYWGLFKKHLIVRFPITEIAYDTLQELQKMDLIQRMNKIVKPMGFMVNNYSIKRYYFYEENNLLVYEHHIKVILSRLKSC